MATQDFVFTIGKGHAPSEGNASCPDLLRLVVPKAEALALAQRILRNLEVAGYGANLAHELEEIPLFGQLEKLEDE